MANINLLPWRAQLRKQRQNEYVGVIGVVVLAAAAIVYSVSGYYTSAIAEQNQRNAFLTEENRLLDNKIKEIKELKATRQRLIERMRLIQELQGNRPVIVRVFDELVRTVPDDLYFNSVALQGVTIQLSGVAKSNSRVATLMRNLDQSDWFADPTLVKVHAKSEGVNEFALSMKRTEPERKGE